MLTEGQLISNRYEIIDKLGSGGMSVVYRAKDVLLDRCVTFKVLREEYVTTEEFTARLRDEAKAVAKLSHPNIVNVYDVGNEGDINYIVMEYIDGATLKDIINRKAPFEDNDTISVALQIAAALSHAHANKIIHRDIKPQNVLVTSGGVIKVTDFGIAKSAISSNTVTWGNVTMGSVHYLSPEQARGGFVEAKSDLYSLGIVMYEMATGTLPFDGDKSVTVALKHINDPLPDISRLNPNVSPALESIIMKLTQKQTINRYKDADELIADLKKALASPDVSLEEENKLSQTKKISQEEIEDIRRRSNGKRESNERYGRVVGYDDSPEGDDGDGRVGPSDWKMILAGVVTAFAIITVIVVIAIIKIPGLVGGVSPSPSQTPSAFMIEVPQLVGEYYEDIINDESIDLKIEMEREEPRDDVEPGIITEQSKNAGLSVLPGATIKVVVSKSVELYPVPEFVGSHIDAANSRIRNEELPFALATETENSDTIEAGIVIRQEPDANEVMPAGTEIVLHVSLGKESVEAPDLRGKTISEAETILEEHGLRLGEVTRAFSDTFPEGQIMGQSAEYRSDVPLDSEINVEVSDGTAPATEEPTEEPEEEPEPTEAPAQPPTEAPIQAPTAAPTEEPLYVPQDSTKFYHFDPYRINTNFANDFNGQETVRIKVIKHIGDLTSSVWEEVRSTNDFPATIPLTDKGRWGFDIYVNDKRYDSFEINFDEWD